MSSAARPTNGIVRRTERVLSPSTAYATSPPSKPLAATSRRSPKDTDASVNACSVSPARTSSGLAPVCRRAAAFTTDPVTSNWPDGPTPVAASPDSMPTRTRSGSSRPSSSVRRRTRPQMASPARTARTPSSSCTCGSPNTAITASPMNFSGVPRRVRSSSVTAS